MIIDQPVVSGSLNVSGSSNLLGNVAITGSLTVSEGITLSGSIESASFASTALNAPLYLLTSSFESYTSSINNVIKTKLNDESVISGSIQVDITGTTGYSTFSSSISSSIGELSSSVSNLNNTQDSRLNSLEGVTGSYATTGSNVFKGSQTISGSIIPGGVGEYDLGSETFPFKHLYLSSASLYIDGQKVIGSTAQELQITTDNGQSIKILEAGTDNITLQSFDGNIELKSSGDGDVVLDPTNGKIVLKGTTEVFSGNKIQSSINGTPVVFASDLIVSGGITTTGQIIAQSINVQQVTSSIVFSSGSNTFGNDLLNTQTITGSVNITGSLKLNDSNVILTNQTGSMSVATSSLALTSSYVENAQTASYVETAQTASYILQAVSSSYATTASFALNVPVTASFANEALTSSFANEALSSSFASTASFALNVPVTASFANEALSSSFSTNALTASYLLNAPETASYSNEALSSSYALTASFSLNVPVTASYANEALSSSYATTASFSLSGTGFPFSGSAEITGSLLVSELSGSGIRYVVADEDGNLNAQTPGAVIKSTQKYVATEGQTTFTVTNGYATGLVDVYVNGTKLSSDEFVDTSGTDVIITEGVSLDNIVEVVKFLPSSGVSNNALRQLTTFNVTGSQSTFNVDYTPGLLDVYYNGARLSSVDYVASNGTSITFATASVSGDTVDVMVYSYQVSSFSGIGGGGSSTELSYFNTQNSITSSQNLKFDGSNLVITGSIIATDGVSGILSGTSSYSENSNLLDGLDSVSFVQTGSFQSYTSSFSSSVATTTLNLSSSLSSSIGSLSSSIATTTNNLSSSIGSLSSSIEITTSGLAGRITTIEGNYATTGSNLFIGDQVITGSICSTGNIVTTGQIVAQTINVQQVTSSIVYSCGSNIFGNNVNNIQSFTGSLQVSGSNHDLIGGVRILGCYNGGSTGMLHITSCGSEGGGITLEKTSGSAQKYKLGLEGTTNSLFIFNETNLNQPLTLTCDGTMILGGTSTTGTAGTGNGRGNLILGGSTSNKITFNNNSTTVNGYVYSDSSELQISAGAGYMNFHTGNTERMRINSTGAACFACELTAKTLGTNDLILNNLNYECANYVDGTRGSWLVQEGACDLFIINQVSGKKYKFNLIEIK